MGYVLLYVIAALVLVLLPVAFFAIGRESRDHQQRAARTHSSPAPSQPASAARGWGNWFGWLGSTGRAATSAANRGASLITTLVVLVLLHYLLKDQAPTSLKWFNAHGGNELWVLGIVGALALVTSYTRGLVQKILLGILGVCLLIALAPAFEGWQSKRYLYSNQDYTAPNPSEMSEIVGPTPTDLTEGGTRRITWHLSPGACVDIYDNNMFFLAEDCGGQFTDLRGLTPTYFAASRGDSVEVTYHLW